MFGGTKLLKSRLTAEWVILFLAMLALLVAGHQRGWTERFDLFLLDLEGQANAPATDPSIILLKIDDRALEELGAWPWDRAVHAELIERINSFGPRVIAYDVLFVEPSNEKSDVALGQALAASGKVTLPHSFTSKLNTFDGQAPFYPIALFRGSAADIGHVALSPEEDGVARQFDLSFNIEGERFPHLMVSSLALDGASPWSDDMLPDSAFVRYGARGEFREASAATVLDGSAVPEYFKDAIVLVGATSQGLGDRYSVPSYAGGILPGLEMQGAFANAILTDNLIQRSPAAWTLAVQIFAIVLLFAGFWRLSPRSALIAAIGLIAGLFGVFFATLMVLNIWIPVGGALLAIVISYPLWGWRRLASVSRFLESEAAELRGLASLPISERSEGFDVVAQQVTLLKRLTKGVSGNLTLIQDVINASPDAMLVTDGRGAISMGNFAAQDLFGPISQIQGFQLNELLYESEGQFNDKRDELSLGDGRTFWLVAADLDADVGSQVLSLREVTQIKEADRHRRETLEFLSHDMRSPQVAIISLAQQQDAVLEASDRFGRIEDQARRTLKLTEDFVQIARISNEGLEREETEMNSVLQEAADRAFPLAHKKRSKVAFEPGEEPFFARVDPFAVARMLDNLISNAVKFSPDNSQVTLGLSTGANGRIVKLTVTDQGPGLSPERRADPFARFGARDASAGPSSGLGLAYVKQVVDLHDGEIAIETVPAGGTKFVISLASM
ncbi:MAG: CHASE2 domain-containing protein [Erythrobacter sp.]|uniref:CHASE2 domain-containing protein n=1 Tax=Erythrobacter sp. TaxID=1042 RepID=UPI00326496A8